MANQKINIIIAMSVVAVLGAYAWLDQSPATITQQPTTQLDQSQLQQRTVVQTAQTEQELAVIKQAYLNQRSNLQVKASGRVKAILKDDLKGSRHQKFILALDNGLTLLIAHNIDLAPRIGDLNTGDVVEFYGEYEYTEQGGVIHWTHHDPNARHIGGWLKHQGQIYQ